jgi:hypothetical protein
MSAAENSTVDRKQKPVRRLGGHVLATGAGVQQVTFD